MHTTLTVRAHTHTHAVFTYVNMCMYKFTHVTMKRADPRGQTRLYAYADAMPTTNTDCSLLHPSQHTALDASA